MQLSVPPVNMAHLGGTKDFHPFALSRDPALPLCRVNLRRSLTGLSEKVPLNNSGMWKGTNAFKVLLP